MENRGAVASIFADGPFDLRVTENVYPRIDTLNVGPARGVIQELFEAHITGAPGMEHVREIVDGAIMPVPGAVMHAAETLRRRVGDLVAVDVGGATTDVHSVCRDSPEVGRLLVAPEPEAKRTVEGDLGVYVNRTSLLRQITASGLRLRELAAHVGVGHPEVDAWVAALGPLPRASETKPHALGRLPRNPRHPRRPAPPAGTHLPGGKHRRGTPRRDVSGCLHDVRQAARGGR